MRSCKVCFYAHHVFGYEVGNIWPQLWPYYITRAFLIQHLAGIYYHITESKQCEMLDKLMVLGFQFMWCKSDLNRCQELTGLVSPLFAST